jgi:hypothetical protein
LLESKKQNKNIFKFSLQAKNQGVYYSLQAKWEDVQNVENWTKSSKMDRQSKQIGARAGY